MKSEKDIRQELSNCYFGDEAKNYDFERSKDKRRKLIFKIQKKIISSFLNDAKGKNILDIACGTGRFFDLYLPREIYGADISKEMLNQAKKKKNVKRTVVTNAEKLPFKDKTFDITITNQFIMHLPSYKKLIKEMARVTKKGGSIIADFPNKTSISYFFTKKRIKKGSLRHYNFSTLKQIQDIAKENNLEVEEIKGNVVISPRFLPDSLYFISSILNKVLLDIFPKLTYIYYVHFKKK
jgi:ubiquinone/menaquinone biosynthesis C-methylase UbiE